MGNIGGHGASLGNLLRFGRLVSTQVWPNQDEVVKCSGEQAAVVHLRCGAEAVTAAALITG